MFNQNEPIRKDALIGGIIVALSTAFATLGNTEVIDMQTIFLAVSVALGQLAVIAFGAEHARAKVYGPKTVEEDFLDAETVLYEGRTVGTEEEYQRMLNDEQVAPFEPSTEDDYVDTEDEGR